ncbi:MAG: hypothetical protein ACKOEP_09095, partial [Phycisphaerales bacterium]
MPSATPSIASRKVRYSGDCDARPRQVLRAAHHRLQALDGEGGGGHRGHDGQQHEADRHRERRQRLAAPGERDAVAETATLQYLALRSGRPGLTMLSPPLMRDYVGMGMRFGLDPALERRLSLEVVRASQSPEYRTFREAMLGVADGNAPVPSVP